MERTHRLRYYCMGLVTAALAAGLILPAGAALPGKTIQVYTGVDLYVDGAKLQPKDANGNPVEVFVYNGTTYLPVRAVGDAVGKPIHWEGKTNSVYVGKYNGEQPDVWLEDLDYFYENKGFSQILTEGDKDNLGNGYSHAIGGELYRTYRLNGQCNRLTGTFYQRYKYRSDSHKSTFKVYADGELVYSAKMAKGTDPIIFDISLDGVLELKIDFYGNTAALGNCGFYLA